MGQIGGLLGLRLTQGGPPVAPRGAQHPFLCLPQLQFSAVAQKEIWPFFETPVSLSVRPMALLVSEGSNSKSEKSNYLKMRTGNDLNFSRD